MSVFDGRVRFQNHCGSSCLGELEHYEVSDTTLGDRVGLAPKVNINVVHPEQFHHLGPKILPVLRPGLQSGSQPGARAGSESGFQPNSQQSIQPDSREGYQAGSQHDSQAGSQHDSQAGSRLENHFSIC